MHSLQVLHRIRYIVVFEGEKQERGHRPSKALKTLQCLKLLCLLLSGFLSIHFGLGSPNFVSTDQSQIRCSIKDHSKYSRRIGYSLQPRVLYEKSNPRACYLTHSTCSVKSLTPASRSMSDTLVFVDDLSVSFVI